MQAEDYQRARRIEAIRGSRIPTGRALGTGELRALFAACDRATRGGLRNAALLGVLCGLGLRRGEVALLDVGDFDAATGALRVKGKGGRQRLCYVTNGAKGALDAWLGCRGNAPGPLFLPVIKGGRVVMRSMRDQSVLDLVRRIAAAAHVARFSPHDLRRTYISNLLDLGVDLSTVQQLAGHAQITTTVRYDRRGEYARRRAAEMLHLPV
jgi:integrase